MAPTSNIISKLPVEIVQEIFMRLSQEDLGNVRRCCKRWRNLASTEYFCKTKLNFNWSNGIFKRNIVRLPNKIKSLISLDEKILIIAVEPYKIVIIDISNVTVEKCLFAQEFSLVDKRGDQLCAVGNIGRNSELRLQVWNLQSYELINIQTNVTDRCWAVRIYKHLIACMTVGEDRVNDSELHLFNINTGKLGFRRRGIRSVHFNNDLIAMGAIHGIIEIMDLNYNPVMTLNCCNNSGHLKVEMKNDYLVAVSYKYTGNSVGLKGICVCNLKTKVKLYTIEDFAFIGFINENNILIGGNGANLFLVDVPTGKTIGKISDGRSRLRPQCRTYNNVSNNRFIFTKSFDTACMELWCPRTQKLINKIRIEKPKYLVTVDPFWDVNFYHMVSKTHFIYYFSTGDYAVNIMNFGP